MADDGDALLVGGAFALAARDGWTQVTVAGAAREAGVGLDAARRRFPAKAAILLRLGQMADAAALAAPLPEGTVRERLFDLLMRRFDALQPHRAGLAALFRAVPAEPATALLLLAATRRSMAWMLAGAGLDRPGVLRTAGLVAVWTYATRAFLADESADLAATMAAVDRGLERAEQAAGWVGAPAPAGPQPFPELPTLPSEAPVA